MSLFSILTKMSKELITKTYKFGNYKRFYIYEPKERLIEALPYKDRVTIRCFCDQVIIPRLERKLIFDNVACRKGKGLLFGMLRLEKFLKKEYRENSNNGVYFLKCDIKKYFPSINHQILLNKLKKAGFSNDELEFAEKLLDEQPTKTSVGFALGNQSSQWFALLYLDAVDRLVKEKLRIKGYVRYMTIYF